MNKYVYTKTKTKTIKQKTTGNFWCNFFILQMNVILSYTYQEILLKLLNFKKKKKI